VARIGYLAGGPKGFEFFERMHAHGTVAFVSSHPVKNLDADPYGDVVRLAEKHGYKFVPHDQLEASLWASADVVFAAGWQFLVKDAPETLVVFHDSPLPRYRGFAPTVTALVNGEPEVGVTAFKPIAAPDAGPIYAQVRLPVTYPARIGDVYRRLADAYAEAAKQVVAMVDAGKLVGVPQDESRATYSIWRDEKDYRIDWAWPSDRIERLVDAVSAPYGGARTTYGGEEIIVDEVRRVSEMKFEIRQPGKIWSLQDGEPVVVCGEGMLAIVAARRLDGRPVHFRFLRRRLGE